MHTDCECLSIISSGLRRKSSYLSLSVIYYQMTEHLQSPWSISWILHFHNAVPTFCLSLFVDLPHHITVPLSLTLSCFLLPFSSHFILLYTLQCFSSFMVAGSSSSSAHFKKKSTSQVLILVFYRLPFLCYPWTRSLLRFKQQNFAMLKTPTLHFMFPFLLVLL